MDRANVRRRVIIEEDEEPAYKRPEPEPSRLERQNLGGAANRQQAANYQHNLQRFKPASYAAAVAAPPPIVPNAGATPRGLVELNARGQSRHLVPRSPLDDALHASIQQVAVDAATNAAHRASNVQYGQQRR